VTGTLWIDVEDLFEYARRVPRPSGIQRLAFEIFRSLQTLHGNSGLVRFVRHDPARKSFRQLEWHNIETLFGDLVGGAPAASVVEPSGIIPHSPARRFVRKLVHRLPTKIRIALIDALVAQRHAIRAWSHLLRTLAASLSTPRQVFHQISRKWRPDNAAHVSEARFAINAMPGDVLLVLGSPWSHPDYGSLIQSHRKRFGIRFALLVYDLIPLRRPEWCDRNLVRLFRAWFDDVFPLCDHLFAISRATAADIEVYARERGVALPGPVVPIPIGTGFGAASGTTIPERTSRLPQAGSYALIVATVEVRKNHILLFRIWRRLLEELPHDRVPILVFAGRIGWLVDDLMRQIANTNNLDGKLIVVENPADEELVALYKGCLFTLFPSYYEGWGLPVTESLALGKPCFISNRTSLPEAGGTLARSFDPDNMNEAYAMIRNVIEDRAALACWEAQIQREFKPVAWSATVATLLSSLGHQQLPSAADPGMSVNGYS
jgi:glycosyltransferase involved in cell wall biosynthesis